MSQLVSVVSVQLAIQNDHTLPIGLRLAEICFLEPRSVDRIGSFRFIQMALLIARIGRPSAKQQSSRKN